MAVFACVISAVLRLEPNTASRQRLNAMPAMGPCLSSFFSSPCDQPEPQRMHSGISRDLI